MTSESAGDAREETARLADRGQEQLREGRFDLAVDTLRRAVDVGRGADDPKALATALDTLSRALGVTGRISEGIAVHEEALAIFQSSGDLEGQCDALSSLARICVKAGRPRDAVLAQRRVIEISRLDDDRVGEAEGISFLGWILASGGDDAGAIEASREAVAIWRDLGDREEEAAELGMLAVRLGDAGQHAAARDAAAEAVAASRHAGRRGDATGLRRWLEGASPGGIDPRELGATALVTGRGCLSFLAAVGAVAAFLLDGPPILVGALTAVALLGWGTCLASLVALPVGVAVIWNWWGTWWLVAGLALVVFAFGRGRVEITTRLDPDERE